MESGKSVLEMTWIVHNGMLVACCTDLRHDTSGYPGLQNAIQERAITSG